MTESLPPGFPIRTSAGRRVFAPYRRFSQLVTSFFASESHRHPPCALICFPFSFRLFNRSSSFRLFCATLRISSLHGDALDFRLDFKVISYSFSFASHTSFYLCMPICLSIMSMTSPLFLVEDIGFEPMTPCVQGRCSSQLS